METWYGDHTVADTAGAEPHLAGIRRFPVKSLSGETRETATVVADAALAGDRRWVLADQSADVPFDPLAADTDDFCNGKKTAAVHRVHSEFLPPENGGPALELRGHDEPAGDARLFDLWDGETGDESAVHMPLNEFLSEWFDRPVSVRRVDGGRPDRAEHGPSIVSTATLREIAAWFDFDADSARRRFRANLEVGGVPPFWEDRLFGDAGEVVAVDVGETTLEGLHPCARCVVPARDPDTGVETPGFRERFVERRRETRPEWTAGDRYDHDFRAMVTARVPDAAAGKTVSVGDAVRIGGRRAA